jgi:DUF1680 family protein
MPTMSQARLSPVSFADVRIDDRFWAPRIAANRERTIPCNYKQCKETGRIDALKLDWKLGQPNPPHIFWESDIAKFLEAASYSLKTHPDADLEAKVDDVIALLQSAQQPDGYLNAHYTVVNPGKRWTNLRDNHELYCAGHLFEAGVAHFEATGKRTLLDVCRRYADCIAATFGVDPGKKRGYCGHPEIELALVKLARATGETKYLDLARYFVDERGRQPHYFDAEALARGEDPKECWHKTYAYCQAHVPLREQAEVAGHAVRAMYIYTAMADLAAESGDQSLQASCERLWEHATSKLMYVTGGLGTSAQNEGFTFDFDLPNETAYCETCAAIGLVMWGRRMLELTGDGRYADVIERALYNAVISGVSLDGSKFFYENPLASLGKHHRKEWFGCSCCPPNIARLLASLGGYVYSQAPDSIAIDLYVQSAAKFRVAGRELTIRQQTDYPWDGAVRIGIDTPAPAAFELRLRRPDWSRKVSLKLNGVEAEVELDRGYFSIKREWSPGDTVELKFDLPVERVYANPKVRMNCGRVALRRGPVLYCLEGADNGTELNALELPRDAKFSTEFEPSLLGGLVSLKTVGRRIIQDDEALYRVSPPQVRETALKAIPYYAWDNRDAGEMLVWIREAGA